MAKTITTRIQNKFDSYANWENTSGLLKGEIALVQVTNKQTDDNGNIIEVPALLMKVGNTDAQGKAIAFNDLPWLSAKAADVYAWAKGEKAEDINIKFIKKGDTDATTAKLGTWLKTIYDMGATNEGELIKHSGLLDKINGTDTVDGSFRKAIKDAIEALDVTDSEEAKKFVTVVSQADGKISVTRRELVANDIPELPTSKIVVSQTDDKTIYLDEKLDLVDGQISTINNESTGILAQAKGYVDGLIDGLVYTSTTTNGTSYEFIDTVTQTNGKISATKKAIPEAVEGQTAKGIVALGVTGGAATHDSVFGADTEGTLEYRIDAAEGAIDSIRNAIAGGVHFRGTTTTELTDGATTATIKIKENNVEKDYTLTSSNAGDVVLYNNKEFIWTGAAWEELGDLTLAGQLSAWREGLDYTEIKDGAATNSKFVTKVTQDDGRIAVTYARPTADDVLFESGKNTTVKTSIEANTGAISKNTAKLADIAEGTTVGAVITNKINGLNFSDPTANGNATSFINSIKLEDGTFTVTKCTVTSASTSTAGIVQLNDTVISDATDEAATANAVKIAYDKAEKAEGDAAYIAKTYVRFASVDGTVKLYAGTGNEEKDEIIFDCGGAV